MTGSVHSVGRLAPALEESSHPRAPSLASIELVRVGVSFSSDALSVRDEAVSQTPCGVMSCVHP